MTQGLFISGRRPKSKKEVKELVDRINEAADLSIEETVELAESNYLSPNAYDPFSLVIEATSMFGNEYSGSLANAPKTARGFTFVGPDPYSNRKFYGTLSWSESKGKWVVK